MEEVARMKNKQNFQLFDLRIVIHLICFLCMILMYHFSIEHFGDMIAGSFVRVLCMIGIGHMTIFIFFEIRRLIHKYYDPSFPFCSLDREINRLTDENRELEDFCENLSLQNTDHEETIARLHREMEVLHHQIDGLNKIHDLSQIYELYQIFSLIRKYNISRYDIMVYPVHADVFIPMVTYTKISIHKELLNTVSYHIDGTDVILGGKKK